MYCITPGKECYVDTYLYDEFITDRDSIPYHFALINNGKIVAIGNEYGREGGVTDCCKDACFASNVMKSKIYPFVKDYPIGTVDDWQDPMLAYCNTYEDLIKLKTIVR